MSRFLLYALVFLVPFVFVQNTNELFEFPKMYVVYFVGSLLVVVTALERLWGAGDSARKLVLRGPLSLRSAKDGEVIYTRLSALTGLFVASFVISTLFSTHLYTSVWGYFSRLNGGFISVLVFLGIYISARRVQPSAIQILRLSALTILPISIYAVLQHFGLGGKWESNATIRAFSTFGQPNWYSAYCTVVLPIVLYFALEERNHWVNKQACFLRNRIAWFSLFILGFCGFWYSYSVSGILGLIASLGLLLALNSDAVKKNWSTFVLVILICLLFAFLNPGIFKQKVSDAFVDGGKFIQAFMKKPTDVVPQALVVTPLLRDDKSRQDDGVNSTSVQYAISDSGLIRRGIWEGAVKLATSSPKIFLIGTGPETFPYEFQKFRPTSLNYSSEWNYILNKPHNYYLELLTQNGIIGLLIYLAIVIKVLLTKHRILTPTLFGLFVTNIFGWPTVSTSLLFWIFLALLTTDDNEGEGRRPEKLSAERFEGPSPPRLVASIILIAAYVTLNVQFTKQYLADTASKRSQNYFDQGNIQKALEYANKSVKLNPSEPFYYRTRAKTYMLTTVGQSADQIAYTKSLALKDILKAEELSPQNLATLRGLVPLYYFLSLNNISSATKDTTTDDNTDPFYLEIAQNYYKKLSMNYPTDVGVLALVAKYQKILGFTVGYENTIGQIKVLRPDILDWYLE